MLFSSFLTILFILRIHFVIFDLLTFTLLKFCPSCLVECIFFFWLLRLFGWQRISSHYSDCLVNCSSLFWQNHSFGWLQFYLFLCKVQVIWLITVLSLSLAVHVVFSLPMSAIFSLLVSAKIVWLIIDFSLLLTDQTILLTAFVSLFQAAHVILLTAIFSLTLSAYII